MWVDVVVVAIRCAAGNAVDLKLKCNQSLKKNDNFPVVSSHESRRGKEC